MYPAFPSSVSILLLLDQNEVFEHAKEANIITLLETGAGKTLISVLLINHICSNPASKPSPIFFLVNLVALVEQQSNFIAQSVLSHVQVARYYSGNGFDNARWQTELSRHHVHVMTTAIFLTLLEKNLVQISLCSLLIFNECHHATGSHPMNEVMSYYRAAKKNPCRCRAFSA